MGDRDISVTLLVAIGNWTLGLALIIAGMVTSRAGVGQLGLWNTALGACLTVRCFLLDLQAREKNAFLLGRDSTEIRNLR